MNSSFSVKYCHCLVGVCEVEMKMNEIQAWGVLGKLSANALCFPSTIYSIIIFSNKPFKLLKFPTLNNLSYRRV